MYIQYVLLIMYNGMYVCYSHTLAAHALSELGEYREAMRHEKIAFGIFNEKVCPCIDHEL